MHVIYGLKIILINLLFPPLFMYQAKSESIYMFYMKVFKLKCLQIYYKDFIQIQTIQRFTKFQLTYNYIQKLESQQNCFHIKNIIIKPMNFLTNRIFKISSLISKNIYNYGEISFTQQLHKQDQFNNVQAYRAYDLEGQLLDKNVKFDLDYMNKILKTMIYVDQMDSILLKVKGQGKISFYMTSFGQGACIVGSAAALKPSDLVYTQYRQQGAHYWRGYTIDQMINQCIGNSQDTAKGRQMPIHYGSKQCNNVTVSSPLTTQVPQASGSGYAFRVNGQDKVSACYLGEGAASQGDFAVGLNFAATLKCQTLFLCRNNKYAISTPTADQYASDGIIPRVISMGIASTRVDGNDALACLEATRKARQYIVNQKKPFFIEFMTYRMGDHSTSDNSALYRSDEERKWWREKNDPIARLTKFLSSQQYKSLIDQVEYRSEVRKQVTQSLRRCQKYKFPPIETLFDDVYDKLPKHLQQQREQLREHLRKYSDKYQFLDKFQQ